MLYTKDFDLKLTFESGQPLAFYGDYSTEGNRELLSYVTNRGLFNLYCNKTRTGVRMEYEFSGDYTSKSARTEVCNRLDLRHDLRTIHKFINTDAFMAEAINALRGLRVTKNEPWEATLCFLASQFNNIKRTRLIIKRLMDRFGEELNSSDTSIKLFPSPEAISNASTRELTACGTGFRAKYLKSVAGAFAGGFDFESLYDKSYENAKQELMKLHGIGDKVADCILLFGYGKLESFPVDLWVKRAVEHIYFGGRKKSVAEIHRFASNRWNDYSGYAQQYIFWYGRSIGLGKEGKWVEGKGLKKTRKQ